MKIEVLYTSESVRRSVRSVFGSGAGRRVAVVAFVGKGAEAYLPKPRGLELYCWPAAPGTNPAALKQLSRKMGVDVSFASRLHMKLYWSERQGAVVTSANLSSNALGHGDLKEFGVRLPPGTVDIDRVLRGIGAVAMTAKALTALEAAYAAAKAKGRQGGPARVEPVSFAQWFESPKRDSWKLAPWYGEVGASRRLRAAAKEERPDGKIANWVNCRRGDAKENDYLLCVDVSSEKAARTPEWLFVSRVVLVEREDRAYEPGFPFQAGQVHPLRFYRRPPFTIDPAFRTALGEVSKVLGVDGVQRYFDWNLIGKPAPKLLALLYDAYTS